MQSIEVRESFFDSEGRSSEGLERVVHQDARLFSTLLPPAMAMLVVTRLALNGRAIATAVQSIVCALAMCSCESQAREALTVILPPTPGWYVIVWDSDQANAEGTIDNASSLEIDFTKNGRVALIGGSFESGWAKDRFYIEKKGVKADVAATDWEIYSDSTGAIMVSDRLVDFRVFFLGRSAPTQSYDDVELNRAILEVLK